MVDCSVFLHLWMFFCISFLRMNICKFILPISFGIHVPAPFLLRLISPPFFPLLHKFVSWLWGLRGVLVDWTLTHTRAQMHARTHTHTRTRRSAGNAVRVSRRNFRTSSHHVRALSPSFSHSLSLTHTHTHTRTGARAMPYAYLGATFALARTFSSGVGGVSVGLFWVESYGAYLAPWVCVSLSLARFFSFTLSFSFCLSFSLSFPLCLSLSLSSSLSFSPLISACNLYIQIYVLCVYMYIYAHIHIYPYPQVHTYTFTYAHVGVYLHIYLKRIYPRVDIFPGTNVFYLPVFVFLWRCFFWVFTCFRVWFFQTQMYFIYLFLCFFCTSLLTCVGLSLIIYLLRSQHVFCLLPFF